MRHLFFTIFLLVGTASIKVDACDPFNGSDSMVLLANGFYAKNISSSEPFWYILYIDNTYPFYSGDGGNQLWATGGLVYPPNTLSTALHVVAINQSDSLACFNHVMDSLGFGGL